MLISPDQFFSNYNGQYLDVDKVFGDQCVDPILLYMPQVVGIPSIPGNAKDYWYNLPPQYFDSIPPTGVPQKGDIAIWSAAVGGGSGHIAIVRDADSGGFTSFDQNWPVGSNCHFVRHDYKNLLGFRRPKNLNIPAMPTPPRILADVRFKNNGQVFAICAYDSQDQFNSLGRDWNKIFLLDQQRLIRQSDQGAVFMQFYLPSFDLSKIFGFMDGGKVETFPSIDLAKLNELAAGGDAKAADKVRRLATLTQQAQAIINE